VLREAVGAFGSVDGLVNGAGVCSMAPSAEVGPGDWDTEIATNVRHFLIVPWRLPR